VPFGSICKSNEISLINKSRRNGEHPEKPDGNPVLDQAAILFHFYELRGLTMASDGSEGSLLFSAAGIAASSLAASATSAHSTSPRSTNRGHCK
jgi:hypothetical protein